MHLSTHIIAAMVGIHRRRSRGHARLGRLKADKWSIANADSAVMTEGADFNVLVRKL
jgi:hypothetical protein